MGVDPYVKSEAEIEKLLAGLPASQTEIELRVEWGPREQLEAGIGRVAVGSLAKLARFKKLESLALSYLGLSDDVLGQLGKLKIRELKLARCAMSSWSWLSSLPAIEKLAIHFCELVELSFVTPLVGLKRLDVFTNRVVNITPVAGLKNLQELDIGFNQIVDLAPLAELKKLKKLRANGQEDAGGRNKPFASLAPLDELRLREVLIDSVKKEKKRFVRLHPDTELRGQFY